MKQISLIILVVIVHSLVLSGCGQSISEFTPEPGLSQAIDIHTTFRMLHNRIGHLCGAAISPAFTVKVKLYQYTRACLYVYEANAAAVKQIYLAKLGKELVEEFPADPDLGEGYIYLNGHTIWPELTSLYNDYGQLIIGLPRTGLILNSDKSRYEQYFERMAFYRNFNDPAGTIHSIPLGAWMCAAKCDSAQDILNVDAVRIPAIPRIGVDPSLQSAEDLFRDIQERIEPDFTGLALTPAFHLQDGQTGKIYENLVMVIGSEGQIVKFLRLPQLLGIVPDVPVSMNGLDNFRFYPVTDGGLGYNVHQVFVDYITMHGAEAVGQPITELHPVDAAASRQCFEFVCLENHPTAPEGLKVRPTSLGTQYLAILESKQNEPVVDQSVDPNPTLVPEDQVITKRLYINVWERYPLMAPGMKQEIGASLIEGDLPITGADFLLYVDLPDGSRPQYRFPPTNRDGQTSITLDPIDAPVKTNIPYQVCLQDVSANYICISESFLIWLVE